MRRAWQRHVVQGRVRPLISWPSELTARGDVWTTRKDGAGHRLNGRHDYMMKFTARRPSAQPCVGR
jgi:hypothetical protein